MKRVLLVSMGLLASLAAGAAAQSLQTTLGEQVTARAGAESTPLTSNVRSVYIVRCAGCHGVDGAGAPAAGVPDLRQMGAFLRLEGGRDFLIKVPGVMGSGMDDRQVAEVTNWLLANVAAASVPEGHRPYDAAEAGAARRRPLVDVAQARAALVEQARQRGVALYGAPATAAAGR
jgi:mono/diheme cytochrome c family protein